MLTNIGCAHFKCFENLDLRLAPLTLLSGVNGGGKSSVVQAMVLLAQTLNLRERAKGLLLDGPEISLGAVVDVVSQYTASRQMRLTAAVADETISWTFSAAERRALMMELIGIERNGVKLPVGDSLRWLLPAEAPASQVVESLRNLSWITAERAGPRELLPLHDLDHHGSVGSRGELSAGLLHWRRWDEVEGPFRLSDRPPTFYQQVRGHMQTFFPGCDFELSPIEGASAISLRLRSDQQTDFQRPQNVGFGLTQLFPLLVAVVAARPGDVLIIENPEVHLHPKAQQDIGQLLTQRAATGVQVIIETHSDHVLNGVRLAVKKKFIQAKDTAIHFFARKQPPISPQMDADGRLGAWPEGFFDQFDLALSELL